jgi:predicted lactoylglutathione lyase
MARQLFVNIVVTDLPRAKAFYTGLGFTFNAQFTNDDAASMIVSDDAYFMLHTPKSMARFTSKTPCDLSTHVAAWYAFSASSRDEVNAIVDKALRTGGQSAGEPEDHGFMYQHSFLDPDGHHWEAVWMDPAFVQAT